MDDPAVSVDLLCPRCGAPNPLDATICAACGVDMADFRRTRRNSRPVPSSANSPVDDAISASPGADARREFRWLLMGVALVAVVSLIAAVVLGSRARQTRLAHEADLARAEVCFAAEDYLCARDLLVALLDTDTAQRAAPLLARTRMKLAQGHLAAGRFQSARDELDLLLAIQPEHVEARQLMRTVYERWLDDTAARGAWIEFFRLRSEMLQRLSILQPK